MSRATVDGPGQIGTRLGLATDAEVAGTEDARAGQECAEHGPSLHLVDEARHPLVFGPHLAVVLREAFRRGPQDREIDVDEQLLIAGPGRWGSS